MISLGMETCPLGVIGNANRDVGQARQPFHRLRIRGAHVGSSDDAHSPTAPGDFLKRWHQQA